MPSTTRHVRPYLRRRPIDDAVRATIARYVELRFPGVPSPVRELLWAKRARGHLGVSLILFDGVPCILILAHGGGGAERWVYRGLPSTFDTRAFFFHRTKAAWMRTGESKDEARERHGPDFT